MLIADQISYMQWLLLVAGLAAVAVAFIIFLLRALPLCRQMRSDDADMDSLPEDYSYEDAAVVVYSDDDADGLAQLLPQILGQDYPGAFEVVVVNEGESPEVTAVVGGLQMRHRNLYLTCTPDGVRNLSRKKLAITLGIKATRMPVVIMTTSGARIESGQWLRAMMRHFAPDSPVEVVIGYASAQPYDDRCMGARARSFDTVVDAASWLTPAIRRHPWRGTEHNVAYRRELFFSNKGFSRHLNLRHGDDDIFISEIAHAANTAVELSSQSRVLVPGACSPRAFGDERMRRLFTRRFIGRRPHWLATVAFALYVLALVPLAAIVALSPLNYISWICSGAGLVVWALASLSWRYATRSLGGRRLCLSLPLLTVTHPFRQMCRAVRAVLGKSKRYTWE